MKISALGKYLVFIIFLVAAACSPINAESGDEIGFPENQIEVVNQPTQAATFIGNPASYYCSVIMGYDYQITKAENGEEYGECIMPTGEVCNQWDFYSGQCGADYSYCAANDMTLETRMDGNDPYNPTYAVCIDTTSRSDGMRISDLLNLETSPLEVEETDLNRDVDLEITPEALSALPTAFNWRDVSGENWLSPVKNQSNCGSCWAFSAVGVMEAYYNLNAMDSTLDPDFAEEHLVSNCFQSGCSGGQSYNALSYIRDHGIVNETCLPYPVGASGYENYELPCASVCADPTYNKIPNFTYEYYNFTPEELKYYLTQYGPLSVYLSMTGSYNPSTGAMECAPLTPGNINHAVVLTGYDDAGGYWIAKNSWGAGYQDGGYFKVAYDNCNIDNTLYAYIPVNRENAMIALFQTSGEKINLTAEPVSPVGGVTVNTLVPTFTWNNDVNAADYDLYLELEVSEDPIIDTYSKKERVWTWWGEESWSPWDNLEPDTTYYWHLSYNVANDSDDYVKLPPSTLQTFRTGSGGVYPSAPNLSSPSNNAISTTPYVTLDWDPSTPDPIMYEAYFETYGCRDDWGCGYTGYIVDSSVSYVNISNILNHYSGVNEYTWYVRGRNDYAWGDYSDAWKFWVSPYTTRPHNLQPSGGSTLTSIAPELSWSTDNIPDGSWVYYQISTDPLFQPWSYIIEGYQADPYSGSIVIGENLDFNTQYYWRAAYDFFNSTENYWEIGPYSPAVSFITPFSVTYPAAPVLNAPSNGATGLSDPIDMSWNPVAGAEEYEIKIIFDYEENGTIYLASYTDRTYGTSYRLPPFLLDYATEFTWIVKARNSEAWGNYSSGWTFSANPGAMSFSDDHQAKLDLLMIQIDSKTVIPLRILESKLNNKETSLESSNLPEGVRMYFRNEDGEITFIEPTP